MNRPLLARVAGIALLLFAQAAPFGAAAAPAAAFAAALGRLPDAGYADKAEIVAALAASGEPRSLRVLQAMLDGRLFVRTRDGAIVVAAGEADPMPIAAAADGAAFGAEPKSGLARIGINNALRAKLRAAIARLSLGSAEAATRLAAVRQLTENADADSTTLLESAAAHEQDARVRAAMQVAIALWQVHDTDAARRRAAVRTLEGSLLPEARNALSALIGKNADGTYAEADPEVRVAAEIALRRIASRLAAYGAVETIFFGLSLGFVLVLAAIGLAITFGVMGVINMAHGEMMMLGAYTTYVVQQLMPNHPAISLPLAVPAAFVVTAIVGVMIERGIVRFLYGRPLETLLATFGVSLFLQQLVRSVFSANNRPVTTPGWMSGSLEINPALSLTFNRLYIVAFSILVFAALLLLLKRTTLGLQVRAVAQNRAMARAMGVRSDWVDAVTFGLGSGVAGVAGVALSQLTNVGPNLGQSYIIDSFMVVVFGGVGNLWGTLVAGLTLGVANKVIEPYAGAVLAKIVVLVFIILFIQRRPRGLFPQKGRAAEA